MRSRRASSNVPNRAGFSLIELLVVIGIIAILAGLLMVAIGSVQQSAKRAKAKVQIKQLEKAFVAYHDEYGEWPADLIGYEHDHDPIEDHTGIQFGKNAALMLRGEEVNGFNPQNIRYFEISDNQIRVDKDDVEGFVDPWGYCYKYMMDFNDDGVLVIRFTSGISTNEVEGLGVAVWSQGPDGNDQFGADNITSWKTQ